MKASTFGEYETIYEMVPQRGAVVAQRFMSEQLARTRPKRSGNRAVLTKLMNEADDLLQQDESDTPCLQVIVELLGAKLDLVKSLDEEIIEVCNVDEIESEIEVAEEINLRFLSKIRALKDALNQHASDRIKTTHGHETSPSTSPNDKYLLVNKLWIQKTNHFFLDRESRLGLELKRRYTLEFLRLMINHKVRI